MTLARSKIVNPQVTRWYHCISHTVRGARLLDSVGDSRKRWLEQRLEELVGIFSIDVAGYCIMDTHLHLLTHLNIKQAKRWSDEEVLRRWIRLHPPRSADRRPITSAPALGKWIRQKRKQRKFVQTIRQRLSDLGWFMKSLKEPLARRANQQDGTRGAFWAARYKSIAILDEQALLATCVYIDLNPLAAGIVRLPEQARFTSLWTRLQWCKAQGRMPDLQAARQGSVAAARRARGLESGLWLCPLEDRRPRDASRVGLLESFSLGSYLLLVDATSRMLRPGKARVGPQAAALLDRLRTSVETWQATLQQLFARQPPIGVAFSFRRSHLHQAAQHRGCHHLANLNGCPA